MLLISFSIIVSYSSFIDIHAIHLTFDYFTSVRTSFYRFLCYSSQLFSFSTHVRTKKKQAAVFKIGLTIFKNYLYLAPAIRKERETDCIDIAMHHILLATN